MTASPIRLCALLLALLLPGAPAGAADTITVFAAASLGNALEAVNRQYRQDHAVNVRTTYASSGTLARQIEAGAPADILVSADRQWVDFLVRRQRIAPDSIHELLGNVLVLVAPRASQPATPFRFSQDFDLAAAFSGKLCTGETGSVPAGIYARQALLHFGWWNSLQGRLVGTEDVRSALAFVERGECALGIVYRTDALGSDKVMVVGTFPDNSHDPIVYPVAVLAGASPAAQPYFRYLQGDAARAVFRRYGFTVH